MIPAAAPSKKILQSYKKLLDEASPV